MPVDNWQKVTSEKITKYIKYKILKNKIYMKNSKWTKTKTHEKQFKEIKQIENTANTKHRYSEIQKIK